eukprot:UN1918
MALMAGGMLTTLRPRPRRSLQSKRSVVIVKAAGDEKPMSKEDLSSEPQPGIADSLAEFWDDFWYGEYWNEPVGVPITPWTVGGACFALYGMAYITHLICVALTSGGAGELPLLTTNDLNVMP